MNTAKKKPVKKKAAGASASEIAIVLSKAMKKFMVGISEKKFQKRIKKTAKLFAKDIKDNLKKNAAVKVVKKKAAVKKAV